MTATAKFESPPADAEVYRRLRIVRSERGSQFTVQLWRGRQRRPRICLFETREQRESYIAERKEAEDRREQFRDARAATRRQERDKMAAQLKVGTVLRYSWGYEQTNCQFFEIVARSGLMVTIQEIEAESTRRSGDMAGYVKPRPGRFIGEPLRKRIGPWGIHFNHGVGVPIEADSEHYNSWYG